MGQAKCFRCGRGYNSNNDDELAGDGKCTPCIEESKRIAFKVDIEMANRRSGKPESLYKTLVEGKKFVHSRDLGIHFGD